MVETLIALTLAVSFVACNYAANSRVWALLRASLESNAANRTVNGRAEQLRCSTWAQVTDATYLRDLFFSVAPDAVGDLGSLVETIDVIAYPQPSPTIPSLQVTRNNTTGTATAVGSGNGTMPAQKGARVNVTASWTAKGGKARTRQITMLFSPGGISGQH